MSCCPLMIMKTSLSSAMGRPHCGLALTLQLMTLFRSHNLSHNPLNPTQRAWFGQNCRHTVLPLQDQNGKSSDILRSRGLGEDSARLVSCFSCCVSKQFWPQPDRRSSLLRSRPNTGNKDRTIRVWWSPRIDDRSKVNCPHFRPVVWKPM